MVPAEHQRGHLLTQSQPCPTFVPLEAPGPFPQLTPLSAGLCRSRVGEALSPSQVSGSTLWLEGTLRLKARTQNPLYFFPVASWEPTSCSCVSRLSSRVLGGKAWLLSSQTEPVWGGQDGTTSFSNSALSPAPNRVCWETRRPPKASLELLTLPRPSPAPSWVLLGLGPSCGRDGLRQVSVRPRGRPLLCAAGMAPLRLGRLSPSGGRCAGIEPSRGPRQWSLPGRVPPPPDSRKSLGSA